MLDIRTKGKSFIDSCGRERIFNGMNMVYKGDYIADTGKRHYIANWDDKQFKWLKDNGFNIIRLGIIWDAVEHEIGKYDDTYLDWIGQMLDMCEKYGIYAFLDMHQDLYGEPVGGGAPRWATITEGCDHVTGKLWSDAYLFSDAVNKAYYNFWINKKVSDGIGLQDHYANMWGYIVQRFKDHQALIGFDVLNEPFPGKNSLEIFSTLLGAYAQITQQDITPEQLMSSFSDSHKKMTLLKEIDNIEVYSAMTQAAVPLLREFDKGHLASFYSKMTQAIREVTHEGIIMLENCYFSNMGVESSIPPIKNNNKIETLQAYAPHGYDLVVDTPYIVNASNNRVTTIFDRHKNVQERLDVPVLVGEWGAHSMYGEGLYHIKYILGYFDQQKWSHTYWCYHDNIEMAPVMGVLRRPYPQAVSGNIIDYHYDYDTCIFTLEWNEFMGNDAPTEIYLPKLPRSITLDGEFTIHTISDMSDAVILKIPNQIMRNRKLQVKMEKIK